MRNWMRGVSTAVLISLSMMVIPPATAAQPGGRGDSQATFRAYLAAGQALVDGRGFEQAAPNESRSTLRPLDDGRHLCQTDSLLIAAAWFDGNFEGGETRSVKEIRDAIAAVTATLSLDGSTLPTTRTATTRLGRFADGEDVFGFQQGVVLDPGALTVGSHTLQTTVDDPVFGVFDFVISFVVEPAGTGACAS